MLSGNGVPIEFLSAIDNVSAFEDLEFIVKYPEGTYWYLKDIYPKYSCLSGYDVTPIYEGRNGDTFYVMLSKPGEVRFVHFELENDEIYDDYGNNFMLMLANFLISYYEFATEIDIEKLAEYGVKMGFKNSSQLFSALEKADKDRLRSTFELDKKWRNENLVKYV